MFSTSMNQNGVYTDYTGYSTDVSAGFSGDIARWLKLRYRGSYSYDRYMIEDRWSEDASHSFRQSLTLSFFPIEKLEVDISGEHYLDKYQEPEPRQTFFLDSLSRTASRFSCMPGTCWTRNTTPTPISVL